MYIHTLIIVLSSVSRNSSGGSSNSNGGGGGNTNSDYIDIEAKKRRASSGESWLWQTTVLLYAIE